MTSPLAMLAVASPAPSAPASGASTPDSRGSRDGNDASSFSDIMARQRAGQDAAAATPADGSQPAPADAAAADPRDPASTVKDGATAGASQKDDDKAAADVAEDAAPTLAQQALAIAAMALQLQGAPANAAQAAATGQSAGQAGTDAAAAVLNAAGATAQATAGASAAANSQAAAQLPAAAAPADGQAAPAAATATDASAQAGVPGLVATATAATDAKSPDASQPKTPRATATPHESAAGAQGRRDADVGAVAARDTRGGDAGTRGQDDASHIEVGGKAAATTDKGGAPDTAATAPRNAAHATQADMTQALASAWQAPAAPAGASAVSTPGIATPVGQAQWGAELGGQLVLMTHRAGNDTHTAELRLDPPDLGPLRVTIKLTDGVAEASFVSAHAAVRQAVESALPQLQQTLAQAGISLGQANVSDHGGQAGFGGMNQGGDRPGQGAAQTASSQNDTTGDTVQIAVPAPRGSSAGLVDTFA